MSRFLNGVWFDDSTTRYMSFIPLVTLTLTNRSLKWSLPPPPPPLGLPHTDVSPGTIKAACCLLFISRCSLCVHATLSSRLPGDSTGEWHHPYQRTHLFPQQAPPPPRPTPSVCSHSLPGSLKVVESVTTTVRAAAAHGGPAAPSIRLTPVVAQCYLLLWTDYEEKILL